MTTTPLPPEVAAAWWPATRLDDALQALARAAGLPPPERLPAAPRAVALDDDAAVSAQARAWGLQADPLAVPWAELASRLADAGPGLVPLSQAGEAGFVVLQSVRRGRLRLIGPLGQPMSLDAQALREALAAPHEAPWAREIEALLAAAEVPPRRRPKGRAALLAQRLADEPAARWWRVQLPAGAPLALQARQARLVQRLLGVLALVGLGYAGEILGWRLIGDGVLDGRLDTGWLQGWALLLLSLVPLHTGVGLGQARLALEVARRLKARLMVGALQIDVQRLRTEGVGHLIGRVIESQALESLVVHGGLSLGLAVVELAFAAWVLAQGAAPGLHALLLAAWAVVVGLGAAHYGLRLRAWTLQRLALTHTLMERMVGHRTRLAQEQPLRRDAEQDAELQAYLEASRRLDAAAVPVMVAAPALWLMLGLAALMPVLAAGSASAASLAISVGGLLMAQRAFGALAGGLWGLARAVVAWRQVAPLFHAGRAEPPAAAVAPAPGEAGRPLLDAQGLRFGHDPARPVLQDVDLRIRHGDRLLLQGESGSGKSTLAGVLTGQHAPQAGLLLLQGLDRHSLGERWTAGASAAPQFHENHIVSESLAFNLLMGRQWPPREADLAEAQAVCTELGLDDLLQRMPAGLMQRVGETGWQLSHGERSRVFLARALLQHAPLTVLDESFAALDPPTLQRCLACASRRSDALMVIAHP